MICPVLMSDLMCMFCCLQELGCSANEKSLERNLGEMQKKHFKHTNARYNTEDQLDDRNLRTWKLRDLLHVAGVTLQYSHH
jgi:hypothetical protein